jgi:hypothetical protein
MNTMQIQLQLHTWNKISSAERKRRSYVLKHATDLDIVFIKIMDYHTLSIGTRTITVGDLHGCTVHRTLPFDTVSYDPVAGGIRIYF